MPRNRVNYSTVRQDKAKAEEFETAPISKFPYHVVASDKPVKIRRGPGLSYSDTQERLWDIPAEVIDEIDGWGLVKEHEEHRDGWVCLLYTNRTD